MKISELKVLGYIEEELEGALLGGYRRAHKHDDSPSEEDIAIAQLQYVMDVLHEWLRVEDE